MTVLPLLGRAAARLAQAGIAQPTREAARLLGLAWRRPWAELYLETGPVSELVQALFGEFLARRARREPFEYIAGVCSFYGREFEVGAWVLVPRPETETLVDAALAFLRGRPGARALELCAGSGAVILSVAAESLDPAARFVATDLSAAALATAGENARRLKLAGRVSFFEGDLFAALPEGTAPFDLVIANPPYIAAADIPGLDPEIRDWEPREALDGGPDGFAFYPRIAEGAKSFLAPGGMLLVESDGPLVARAVALFARLGYASTASHPDLGGRPRAASGVWPGNRASAPAGRDTMTSHHG